MTKIRITEAQYTRILLHGKQVRLLKEEAKTDMPVLPKNIVFGVAKLLGVQLTGHNKKDAENALNDAETMRDIKRSMEDSNKREELMNDLELKGMKNASERFLNSSDDFVNKFNEQAKIIGVEEINLSGFMNELLSKK